MTSSTNLTLQARLGKLTEYIELLRGYTQFSQEQIEQDATLRGAVERYLYLAADVTISIAQMLLAAKELELPATNREAIERLADAGILPEDFVTEFAKMTGLRNVLAHEYLRVNYDVIYDVLHHRLDEFSEFISHVEAFLKSQ